MTTTQWQNPGTAAFPTPGPQGRPRNRVATAGFVLSVIGLLVSWMPLFGFLVIGPALGLSISGLRRAGDGRASTAGRAVAGIALSAIGSLICLAMSVYVISTAPSPQPVATAQSAPAPVAAPAPVLLSVPNVIGSGDADARQKLLAAGFTNVTLGPSTGAVAGVAAGTVTTQLPVAGARAAAGDPIVLGEAAAPPVVAPQPVVTPQSTAPTQAPAADVDNPRTYVDTPRPVVAAPRAAAVPQASSGSGSSGGSASYANCAAARNAGAAPLYRGDSGYSSKLDRDGDGVACE